MAQLLRTKAGMWLQKDELEILYRPNISVTLIAKIMEIFHAALLNNLISMVKLGTTVKICGRVNVDGEAVACATKPAIPTIKIWYQVRFEEFNTKLCPQKTTN